MILLRVIHLTAATAIAFQVSMQQEEPEQQEEQLQAVPAVAAVLVEKAGIEVIF